MNGEFVHFVGGNGRSDKGRNVIGTIKHNRAIHVSFS